MFNCTGNCPACGRCMNRISGKEVNKRKINLLKLPEDFQAEPGVDGYGIAFDIGTTTVVGILWDMYHGKYVDSASISNPQIQYGQDVISRITFSEKEGNLQILHKLIIDCLNDLTKTLCLKNNVVSHTVYRVTVCGNTTMSHLFLGADPYSLARSPFKPGYMGTIIKTAVDVGLHINQKGTVTLLPNIAGHVGGDITAGILATRLGITRGNVLFIDIGTNGEIVLSCNRKMFACSAAAGPAFEGASIYQGIRACEGAIERIQIVDDEVVFKTIGDIPPVGICGSGLIDAVAAMLRSGIIDETGRLLAKKEYQSLHPDSLLGERIIEDKDEKRFVLVYREGRENIVITQKDVREVQLAKGAVVAGIKIMLQYAGIKSGDLNYLLIAGAFGNYIDKQNAISIGLIPSMEPEKIVFTGNSAAAGALMVLINKDEERKMKKIPGLIEHVNLAMDQRFNRLFVESLSFSK